MSKPKTGPTSFGYQRKGGILVKDPLEAPIRHRIFELFAKHQRKKTVAEILNAEGARTRNGAHFTGQTISRLLQDEQVVGIPGEIEELVPKELFELCQTILTAQSRDGGAKRLQMLRNTSALIVEPRYRQMIWKRYSGPNSRPINYPKLKKTYTATRNETGQNFLFQPREKSLNA